MTSSRPSRAGLAGGIGVLVLLGAAAVWAQVELVQRTRPAERFEQMLYVQSPAVLTRLALSYDAVLADIYWIRTIQYYGGTRLSDAPVKTYDLLYPLLDLTTSLDPRFSIAYRFGAFFLSEPAPGGAGRPDLAIRLLEKAMRANPHRWEYPHDIGFVHYRLGDYRRAAAWFQRAADVPGSAEWLEPLAAVTLARGGERSTSRLLWQQILATADQEWLRRAAEFRLQQLDALDQIDQLHRITRLYEARTGGPPPSWAALIQAGLLRSVPRDPTGIPYELNPWWGDVTVSRDSTLWPLPVEPAAR